ncbi:glycosyltransferase [Haloferula rosea]|uniref:Glycosyltransferase family 4 protein n=1 Tax=Haloferula rosea TaxID=490093 RepID=A0A934RHU7_9BACT|nr:glycosyltransferase [Haloferula rosea]MBK1828801.1 glycosyltransferase family 4 protein [Haloferula rosea]
MKPTRAHTEGELHIIVHHHLRHGGVSRVIAATSHALSKAGVEHVILCGDLPSDAEELPVIVIPALDYDPTNRPGLEKSMVREIEARFGKRSVVWHFHNPALGKNPSLTRAAAALAEQGHPITLQHHDFAEDYRAENYARLRDLDLLYPTAPHIRHVCINSRDRSTLIRAGLPTGQVQVIPNPITVAPITRREPRWIFQPVRGIRRKNLGETLLLAAHAPNGTRFAISRRPDQPNWQALHDHWSGLAEELDLPVEFAVSDRLPPTEGAGTSFTDWLQHSSHLLTTSVAEGFGLTFLEGAALQIPVIGRRLTELDPDLESLPLDPLYTRLLVPSAWLDMRRLEKLAAESLSRIFQSYDLPIPHHEEAPDPPHVEFSRLPEEMQAEVITLSTSHPSGILAETQSGTRPLTDHLREVLSSSEAPAVDLHRFHPDQHVASLIDIRKQLLRAPRKPPVDLNRETILRQFLDPSRFHFLCQ